MRLENYPPGVQCLLKDAAWHMEQLDLLEREFRMWQIAHPRDGPGSLSCTLVSMITPHRRPESRAPVALEKALPPD